MPKEKVVKIKLPKSLAGCADRLYTIRQERYKIQKTVDAIKEEESALTEHLINSLPKSDATGVAGKIARATVESKRVPQATNWDQVWAYIKKNNAWELVQRRLSNEAVKERWDAGKKIPGVEVFNAVTVSLNKV